MMLQKKMMHLMPLEPNPQLVPDKASHVLRYEGNGTEAAIVNNTSPHPLKPYPQKSSPPNSSTISYSSPSLFPTSAAGFIPVHPHSSLSPSTHLGHHPDHINCIRGQCRHCTQQPRRHQVLDELNGVDQGLMSQRETTASMSCIVTMHANMNVMHHHYGSGNSVRKTAF